VRQLLADAGSLVEQRHRDTRRRRVGYSPRSHSSQSSSVQSYRAPARIAVWWHRSACSRRSVALAAPRGTLTEQDAVTPGRAADARLSKGRDSGLTSLVRVMGRSWCARSRLRGRGDEPTTRVGLIACPCPTALREPFAERSQRAGRVGRIGPVHPTKTRDATASRAPEDTPLGRPCCIGLFTGLRSWRPRIPRIPSAGEPFVLDIPHTI